MSWPRRVACSPEQGCRALTTRQPENPLYLIFKDTYLFALGCIRSWPQHVGSSGCGAQVSLQLCLGLQAAQPLPFTCSVVSNSLRPRGLQPARLLCPRDSPGKNTGEGFHALLLGIFPTQGSNPGLLLVGSRLSCPAAPGISIPQPRIEPTSPHWNPH